MAVGGWFALIPTLLGIGFAVFGFGVITLAEHFPVVKQFVDRDENLLLIAGIAIIVVGVIGGDRLWSRLFIQSGYLSDAAAIRILSNRAPTRTSERGHRWLGQAMLIVIYGTLGFMAVMSKQWWILVIVVPLAIWGVFLIRNAWKEADQMLAGGAIPPASEERIRYIEKVLIERGQRDGVDVEK